MIAPKPGKGVYVLEIFVQLPLNKCVTLFDNVYFILRSLCD